MGKEINKGKGLDKEIIPMELSSDEVAMLAYALEYDVNDNIISSIGAILEKIEKGLHVDTYVGNRLIEYGKVMGWSKE